MRTFFNLNLRRLQFPNAQLTSSGPYIIIKSFIKCLIRLLDCKESFSRNSNTRRSCVLSARPRPLTLCASHPVCFVCFKYRLVLLPSSHETTGWKVETQSSVVTHMCSGDDFTSNIVQMVVYMDPLQYNKHKPLNHTTFFSPQMKQIRMSQMTDVLSCGILIQLGLCSDHLRPSKRSDCDWMTWDLMTTSDVNQ